MGLVRWSNSSIALVPCQSKRNIKKRLSPEDRVSLVFRPIRPQRTAGDGGSSWQALTVNHQWYQRTLLELGR